MTIINFWYAVLVVYHAGSLPQFRMENVFADLINCQKIIEMKIDRGSENWICVPFEEAYRLNPGAFPSVIHKENP